MYWLSNERSTFISSSPPGYEEKKADLESMLCHEKSFPRHHLGIHACLIGQVERPKKVGQTPIKLPSYQCALRKRGRIKSAL